MFSESTTSTLHQHMCNKCHNYFSSTDATARRCPTCKIQDMYSGDVSISTKPLDVDAAMPVDYGKNLKQLEDRVSVLEEALEEAEADLCDANARINVLLRILDDYATREVQLELPLNYKQHGQSYKTRTSS